MITDRMATRAPFRVWVPADFTDLGSRDAVDQALHRMTRAGLIRRITRGLYDKPDFNSLTGKPTNPDPRAVIDALARRDSARMIVDGIAAANDIRLSDAVPAHIIVHTDARLKSLALGNLTIRFKTTAPSKLSGQDGRQCALSKHFTGSKTRSKGMHHVSENGSSRYLLIPCTGLRSLPTYVMDCPPCRHGCKSSCKA